MIEVSLCPECGVPEPLSQGQVWLNNGDIVQKANPGARMGFLECENLDPVFKNIGDIIGVTIENLIVRLEARATMYYMEEMIQEDIRDSIIAKQVDPRLLVNPILSYCHIVGFGKYRFLEARYQRDRSDFSKFLVTNPFSVPLVAGALSGALSALVGGKHDVIYGEVSPGIYEFVTNWTENPRILSQRLPIALYKHRDGDIELERCATCGLPKAIGGYEWKLDDGLIVNKRSGRRMALLGPEVLDYLFEALQSELGDKIPEIVVEAQRRFTRTGFYSIDQVSDEGDFRTQLALRGYGNLREIKMGPRGLFMRIDNAAGYLMTVGMVQGLFEMNFNIDSSAEWALSEDRDLEVEVNPR